MYSLINNLNPNYSEETISVNGQSVVKATPNLVGIYFNIETNADTSESAVTKNSEILKILKSSLIVLNIPEDKITTESFNVYPDYIYTNTGRKDNGYKASHQIKIQLSTDDTNQIGEIIDAGVRAGAGISYINFELSQEIQNDYKSEALKLAAQDARIKAESVAEGFDKELGKLVSTRVDNYNYYPWEIYTADAGVSSTVSAEMAKSTVVDIQPGEREISASVTAVYRFR